MDALHSTSEIIELVEDSSVTSGKHGFVKPGQRFSIEDDINRLFESIDIRNSARNLSSSQVGRENLWKKSMKRPIRVGSSQTSKIGISESTSLKQALRGLCVSQASEMAAMKRLSKPPDPSGISEAVTMKRLYRAVAVEACKSGHSLNDGNLVEISLVPERHSSNLSEKISEPLHVSKLVNHTASSSFTKDPSAEKVKMVEPLQQTECFSLPMDICTKTSKIELEPSGNINLKLSSICTHNKEKLPVVDEIVPASVQELVDSVRQETQQKPELHSASYLSSSNPSTKIVRSASTGPKLLKPIFRNKNLAKKKSKLDSSSVASSSRLYNERIGNDLVPSTSKVYSHMPDLYFKNTSPVASSTNVNLGVSLSSVDSSTSKPGLIADCSEKPKPMVTKADERSRAREKGEFSQSSKSSIGEYSSSTSFSDESNLSGSSRSGCRPHMSRDSRWEAVCCAQKQHGSLGLRHFKLLRKIGGGDIGTVYLAELTGSKCLFALKVMDNEFLALRKKISRAQTEREILQLLDHPFLPTLFGHFTTDKFACLVMEYCPGGDLHVLRQKQMSKHFSEQAVRFYVAEALLALEYLHMLGVVYRDLKPENILVREDGHIMLTDFDLSLRCTPNQTLLKPSSPIVESPKKVSSSHTESSCIDPFCLQPSWQVRCFTPRILSAASKSRKLKSELASQVSPLPQLVVEPTSARSNSFVGTHEYLAPEIIKGEGHGSPVDWWTLGILLYELLYGRTPFKGTGNEDTLVNVVSQCLKFPASPTVSSHAKDLIKRLLQKQPENRLGSVKGAAEIKQHPFFEGLNWALIRCAAPPELPRTCDFRSITPEMSSLHSESAKCEKELTSTGDNSLFEMF